MNNTAAGSPLGVVLIQPDLCLAAPPVGVSAAFRGVDTDVTVEITNSGDGATAQTFEVVVYISEDPVAGNEDDIRVDDVAITTELEVGETLTVVVSSRILDVQATCIYHWIAVVDDGVFVDERDGTNNPRSGTLSPSSYNRRI